MQSPNTFTTSYISCESVSAIVLIEKMEDDLMAFVSVPQNNRFFKNQDEYNRHQFCRYVYLVKAAANGRAGLKC